VLPAPTAARAGLPHEVHVRARVDLAQHPVDVERLGVEVEVVALRQHHLEDVAGQDVLAGDLDRPGEEVASHGRPHVGQGIVGRRRLDEGLVDRAGTVGGQLLEAGDGAVVQRVELSLGRVVRHDDVVDEDHTLAPMVVRGQLADD
jgi:hypothetical protein